MNDVKLNSECNYQISGNELVFHFILVNSNDHDVSINYYRPFLQFSIKAFDSIHGTSLPIDEPALDIPVKRINSVITARESIKLLTPIKIFFSETDKRQDANPFHRFIVHAPSGILLKVEFQISHCMITGCEMLIE